MYQLLCVTKEGQGESVEDGSETSTDVRRQDMDRRTVKKAHEKKLDRVEMRKMGV